MSEHSISQVGRSLHNSFSHLPTVQFITGCSVCAIDTVSPGCFLDFLEFGTKVTKGLFMPGIKIKSGR